MRIISGEKRGHKLLEFDGNNVRPTSDRVRESMFNLICDYVHEAKVLDLFGGSGALSFEALSRGSVSSVICDINEKSIDLIKKNAELLRYCDKISVLNIGFERFVKSTKEKFDIIFLDPPYNKGFISKALGLIVQNEILSDDGIIVLECDSTDEHGEFDGLDILKEKKYGRSIVTVYTRGN